MSLSQALNQFAQNLGRYLNSAFRISRTAAQSYSCKDWGHSAYLKPLEWWLKPTTHDGNLPKAPQMAETSHGG